MSLPDIDTPSKMLQTLHIFIIMQEIIEVRGTVVKGFNFWKSVLKFGPKVIAL
jgi:hypothetical protein